MTPETDSETGFKGKNLIWEVMSENTDKWMGSETEEEENKEYLFNSPVFLLLRTMRSSPTGNSRKHASKYYQKGKEAGKIILQFPSDLPCMWVRKSQSRRYLQDTLMCELERWESSVCCKVSPSERLAYKQISFSVMISLQRRSAFLMMKAMDQNFEV